jgi:hypothetical protein
VQPICAKRGWVQEELVLIKVTSNLWLLSEPLLQLSVIEFKVLSDALCVSYYIVEVNYNFYLFEEIVV